MAAGVERDFALRLASLMVVGVLSSIGFARKATS